MLGLCAGCGGAGSVRPDKQLAQTPPDRLHPEEYAQAARDYQRACDGGTAQACGYLGFMYDNGQGVEADVTRAVDLSTRACSEAGA
jgi:TPR repeat protein